MAKDFAEAASQPEQAPAQEGRTIQQAVISHAQNDLSAMPDASHIEDRPQEVEAKAPVENEGTSFTGELAAMLREGAKDLHNAIVPAFPDSLKGVEELGTPMNPTQSMVNEQLVGDPEKEEVSFKQAVENTPEPQVEQQQDIGREM